MRGVTLLSLHPSIFASSYYKKLDGELDVERRGSHVSLPSSYIYDFYEIVTQLLGLLPGRPNKRHSMASPVIISATAKHTATVIAPLR